MYIYILFPPSGNESVDTVSFHLQERFGNDIFAREAPLPPKKNINKIKIIYSMGSWMARRVEWCHLVV